MRAGDYPFHPCLHLWSPMAGPQTPEIFGKPGTANMQELRDRVSQRGRGKPKRWLGESQREAGRGVILTEGGD